MPRSIDYNVPAEYEGRKVVHFLRGYCGFSARVMRKVKYSLKLLASPAEAYSLPLLSRSDSLFSSEIL